MLQMLGYGITTHTFTATTLPLHTSLDRVVRVEPQYVQRIQRPPMTNQSILM